MIDRLVGRVKIKFQEGRGVLVKVIGLFGLSRTRLKMDDFKSI
jgi:hypothetical protein